MAFRGHKKQGSCLFVVMALSVCASGCGNSESTPSTTPTPTPKATQTATAQGPNAGRYTEYYKTRPLVGLTPFEPQPTFYALLYNCGSCHDFVKKLSSVQSRLAKNKSADSLQKRITSGSMPPDNPNFAKSAEGIELLDMLNKL